MRTVFFGSPDFAVPALEALLARSEVVAVVTQPDKPAGRGQHAAPPPVKVVAEKAGVRVLQPTSARAPELREELARLAPDLGVVVAYGKILPQALLDTPRRGCVNLHASLLPRHRGASPIQWAILEGDAETGVTLMQMEAGLDTGPALAERRTPIGPGETAGELALRLARLGAELLVDSLEALAAGALAPTPQDGARATQARLLKKDDGRVPWDEPGGRIAARVRAMDPWPGAFALLAGQPLKLFAAHPVPGGGAPGEILGVDRDGLIVGCGDGAIAFAELQAPGKRRMPATAFVAGRPLPPGVRLA